MSPVVEHSDSEKNIRIRFDFPQRIDFLDSIRFSTSLPYRRIGYYRLLCCQMSTLFWRLIIDQANAAAESNGRFLKIRPKRIDSNRESECSIR